MREKRYPDEFKIEAVKQVTERGHQIADVAERLGVTPKSFHNWINKFDKPEKQHTTIDNQQAEIRKLKAELRRVTKERNNLKGGHSVLCKRVKEKYTFIKSRLRQYPIRTLCKTLGVNRSDFYSWLKEPHSPRAIEDKRLLGKIKQYWLESGCVYGYINITLDLKDDGETVGKNRVYRIMSQAKIKAIRSYKRNPSFGGGNVSHTAPNTLNRGFDVDKPNKVWVTDFTFIRTHEGWLYLTVVIDLFSRQVVGWTMKSSAKADLVIDALLMAVWRRSPSEKVLIHSAQGVQYTSSNWRSFLKENNLQASMSRRGKCHDNAVAESFFSLLKKDRVKRKIYRTRAEARSEIFNYIEYFYNPVRHHGSNNGLSPMKFEKQYYENLESS
ncbi:IS3 family transposase [Shewanella woodyi]|uniref:IS3 family transposase n=1 Tax=Shewanella woodyi TaxID=60961 RepID=UPI0018A13636|nr:IS3 family transposase [Shewanella woodyi]